MSDFDYVVFCMYNVIYIEFIKLNFDYNIKYIIVLYVGIFFLYIEILNVGGENML